MSRKRIVAGNWKMNTTLEEARALASEVAQGAGDEVDLVLIPPTCFLAAVLDATASSAVSVGAQNMHPAASGAFTGETSGPMLTSLGAQYVVCGHSERRHVFGESSAFIGEKVSAAHANGLIPILCVGETLEDREAGRTDAVVLDQLAQPPLRRHRQAHRVVEVVDGASIFAGSIGYSSIGSRFGVSCARCNSAGEA